MERTTHYVNTDLELLAAVDLAPLVQHFESKGFTALHFSRIPRKGYLAVLETQRQFVTPQATIKAMLRGIETMPREINNVWAVCKQRSMNIGYQCGHEPHSIEHGLDNDLMNRIVRSGLALKITLYRVET